MICPGVKSGYCFNGGFCLGGTTCLCGFRSEWSGADCSESKLLIQILLSFSLILFFLERCSGGYRCFNGGLCGKNTTARTCICPPNYEGSKCETPVKH